jgi:hypothetical protein
VLGQELWWFSPTLRLKLSRCCFCCCCMSRCLQAAVATAADSQCPDIQRIVRNALWRRARLPGTRLTAALVRPRVRWASVGICGSPNGLAQLQLRPMMAREARFGNAPASCTYVSQQPRHHRPATAGRTSREDARLLTQPDGRERERILYFRTARGPDRGIETLLSVRWKYLRYWSKNPCQLQRSLRAVGAADASVVHSALRARHNDDSRGRDYVSWKCCAAALASSAAESSSNCSLIPHSCP